MNDDNNNIKLIANTGNPKMRENNIINSLNNYYKKGAVNHERNLTNYQLCNKNNDNDKDFLYDLKDIEQRENKMNKLKNEITNNNKLIANLSENAENKEIDVNKIINKQEPLSNYNRQFSQHKNNNKENNINNKNEIKSEQENKEIKINKNHISLNKKVIYDKILNNINENEPRKNVLNKLKVENINLKVKNGLLKTTIEKKEKIIEALNKKINELENKININNNEIKDDNNEKLKKEINELKNKNKELLELNKNLLLGIEFFNQRLLEINVMLEKKNYNFSKEIDKNRNKLSEYRRKIILLKRRVNELYKNEYPFEPIKSSYNNNYKGSFILNRNRNLMNRNKILMTDYVDIRKGEDKFSRQRSNTFLHTNYFENI